MTTPTQQQQGQTQAPAQQSSDGATKIGPFIGGLHNSTGNGEFIDNAELYELTNIEVDTDGSLANRPEIKLFNLTGVTAGDISFIGTYLPADGRKFIVANCPNANAVVLIDSSSGVQQATVATGVQAVCCMQYANRLFVVATVTSGNNGGYFDVPTSTTVSWTTVASMPRGEACAQYRERMFIACGVNAVTNTSRFSYSAIGDPSTAWSGTDFFDVVPGNGQKLVSLLRVGNDLVLFKEHSTHKFTYTSDVRKAEINEVDGTIGNPAINCSVVYNNSIVYVLHDNSVYELYQYNYTRISGNINLAQILDATMYSKDQYGLTIHRDRLFVRYYANLYVSNLKVKKWCLWSSTRKFSKVVVIPSASVGLDQAYAVSCSTATPGAAYRFQDTRVTLSTGVSDVVNEWFQGKITTKTFDFDAPQSYKVLFWWGIACATSGNVYSSLTIPNATGNLTWDQAQTAYGSWGGAAAVGAKWSSNPDLSTTKTVLPQLGKYSRKFIKLPKKIRFRQVIFSLTFDILTNGGVADATLRIYDLTIFIKQKQTVVKEVS